MVTVVDTATNAVTARVPVPTGPPQYLAYSPDGRRVYVSIWNQARTVAAVGVLDTATNQFLATIPVRTRPYLSAVTPDGQRLYVPNHDSGTISVIDTGTNTVTVGDQGGAEPALGGDVRGRQPGLRGQPRVQRGLGHRHIGQQHPGRGAGADQPAQPGRAPGPAAGGQRELRLGVRHDDRHQHRPGGGHRRGGQEPAGHQLGAGRPARLRGQHQRRHRLGDRRRDRDGDRDHPHRQRRRRRWPCCPTAARPTSATWATARCRC